MKKPPVTAAQWAHAREAGEGAPMTRTRIAGMLGVHPGTVDVRMAQEGWRKIDFRRQDVVDCYREATRLSAMHAGIFLAADHKPFWMSEFADAADEGEIGRAGGDERTGAAGGAADGEAPHGEGGRQWPGDASSTETEDPVEMLARASAFASRQLGRLIAAADRRGGRLDKAQIEALSALSRMMERREALASERALKERQDNDDERAGTHREVVDHLVKLAEAETKRLVKQALAARPDEGAGWRVVVEGEA